jgi:aryl-alcohol dehydrogenase-like predicted oxidoreductase
LQVERIDLYQLHSWGPTGHRELDWLETLNDLRAEGKIAQIGISLRDNRPDEGVTLAKLGLVASQQVIFNMFEQHARERLLPAAQDSGTAIVARVPLDSSALTGTWDEQTYDSWEAGSQRHEMFRGDRFTETLARMRALKADVAPYYENLAEAALRYVLAHDAISGVIPGMATPAEVDMNLAVSDGAAFPEDLTEKLAKHAWVKDFYS